LVATPVARGFAGAFAFFAFSIVSAMPVSFFADLDPRVGISLPEYWIPSI
jgi:hypothetical protein